tara:strand:- start:14935 stop:15954 length:1020 start_codon:yes stop_codon:yes gene_type:complete
MSCDKPLKNKNRLKGEKSLEAKRNQLIGRLEGIAGGFQLEPEPEFIPVPSEHVMKGKNNTFVVLGRDRPSHEMSGMGGKGATQCGKIDLIAGMASSFTHEDGERTVPDQQPVSPNFVLDAARIYISQRTHLDRYMGIADSNDDYGEGYSGIGLKADTIRMHSRGNIKIVTGRSKFQRLGRDGERFSNGCVNEMVGTISFIAGNKTGVSKRSGSNMLSPLGVLRGQKNTLQPLVKGENLIECLDDIVQALQRLSRIAGNHEQAIMSMSRAMATHSHVATSPGAPVLPSFRMMSEGIVRNVTGIINKVDRSMLTKNFELIRTNYLKTAGSDYINSRDVFTT